MDDVPQAPNAPADRGRKHHQNNGEGLGTDPIWAAGENRAICGTEDRHDLSRGERNSHGGGHGKTKGFQVCPHPKGCGVTSLGSCPCQEQGSRSGLSPQAHEEDEGHKEGPEGDAVSQVVDDDSDVIVQLAFLLGRGKGDREGVSRNPSTPQSPFLHHVTSQSCSADVGTPFRSPLEPTWYRMEEKRLEGTRVGQMGLIWTRNAQTWPRNGLRHFTSYPHWDSSGLLLL